MMQLEGGPWLKGGGWGVWPEWGGGGRDGGPGSMRGWVTENSSRRILPTLN